MYYTRLEDAFLVGVLAEHVLTLHAIGYFGTISYRRR